MKKSIICILSSILLIAGCQPINPPQSEEEVVRIITILYNGLGKPAKVCLEPLAELGFNVPYYLPDSRTGYVWLTPNAGSGDPINISSLARGYYIITVVADGENYSRMFIKRR